MKSVLADLNAFSKQKQEQKGLEQSNNIPRDFEASSKKMIDPFALYKKYILKFSIRSGRNVYQLKRTKFFFFFKAMSLDRSSG